MAIFEISAEFPGTKLITPGGRPASSRICIPIQDDKVAVAAGFHSTEHPIIAGAAARFTDMDVKLNGAMA
jgi:hypothetical protein